MARVRVVAAALVAAAAVMLTGCSGGDSPEGGGGDGGGSLTFLFPTGPVDMDPSTSQDNNVAMPMWNAWFEELIAAEPGSSDYAPMLASEWDVSDDGLTYSFTLDDRATFSDGSQVTAADVVFSLTRNMEPEISLLNFLNAKIDAITATDESTVTIQLVEPWPHLLADLAGPNGAIYSQAAFEATDAQTFFNSAPVGSGPFTLTDVKPNSSYTLQRNADYWNPDHAAKLDTITLEVVTDENARVTAVQGGSAQIAQSPPASQFAALKDSGDVTTAAYTAARIELIALNTTKPPFDNQAVRQAFSLALDRQAIVDLGVFGLGVPATSFLVPPPEATFQNPSLALYPFDLDKAKKLIAESGVATPIPITLEVSAGSAQDAILTIAQDSLTQIGFEVTASRKDAASVDNDIISGQFQANTTFWGNVSGDPSIQSLFAIDPDYCCQAYFTGLNDPDLVALTKQAIATTDRGEAQKLWDEVQIRVADAAHLIPLFNPQLTYVLRSDVTGFAADPYGFYDWAAIGYGG